MAFGFTATTILAMVVFSLLLAISLIDIQTMEIPDGLNIVLAAQAIVWVWLMPEVALTSRIIGFFAVSGFMFIMALAISGAFGGGDIKLMAACGFMLGWQNILLAFFIAIILGGTYALYMITVRKRRGVMVFGPALCVGIFTALVYGDYIITWYIGLLGF